MPDIIIVAGPNGAGKSTFIERHLPERIRQSFQRLDADEIEKTLDPGISGEDNRALAAGRMLLNRMQDIIDARGNLIIETTLTLRVYSRKIPEWQRVGYRVALIYLRLPSVELSLARVKRRVAAHGHNIPEATIRRRFDKSLKFLDEVYKPLVDEWYVWDSVEEDFIPASAWDIA